VHLNYISRVLSLKDRIILDRRRLEDAHMIYAVLNVFGWYPAKFGPEQKVIRPSHFNEILGKITPIFHQCFSEQYAGTATIYFCNNLRILYLMCRSQV